MANTDPDTELVRLAQAGDVHAFEALVVKYQRRIARHVARYVRRAADVEDVVQDTFIRAYRGLHRSAATARSTAGCTASRRTLHSARSRAIRPRCCWETTPPTSAATPSSQAFPTAKIRS